MIMQIVNFESALSEEEVIAVAKERMDQFRPLPGLLQKYYAKNARPNHYAGIYIWDSMESFKSYRESEMAAGIPKAYKVVGQPDIEIKEIVFQLRE